MSYEQLLDHEFHPHILDSEYNSAISSGNNFNHEDVMDGMKKIQDNNYYVEDLSNQELKNISYFVKQKSKNGEQLSKLDLHILAEVIKREPKSICYKKPKKQVPLKSPKGSRSNSPVILRNSDGSITMGGKKRKTNRKKSRKSKKTKRSKKSKK